MNIQDELQKIHHQYGTSEKANYEIQKLFDQQNEPPPTNDVAFYTGTQTPIERLRNKLSPFITIVELLNSYDDEIVSPFIEHTRTEARKNEMFDSLLKTCTGYKEDVKAHLSDCENFYSMKENQVNRFPTKKVCFFKIEDGKYIAENGIEALNKALVMPRLYGVTDPNGYLEFFWDKEKAEKSIPIHEKKRIRGKNLGRRS